MNDRELLELAAKAAGIGGGWGERAMIGPDEVDLTDLWFMEDTENCVIWNPLADDGDALRLAVKLEIFTGRYYDCIVPACFASWNNRNNTLWEPAGDDAYSATRRAIVRAAAEIGRSMQ